MKKKGTTFLGNYRKVEEVLTRKKSFLISCCDWLTVQRVVTVAINVVSPESSVTSNTSASYTG